MPSSDLDLRSSQARSRATRSLGLCSTMALLLAVSVGSLGCEGAGEYTVLLRFDPPALAESATRAEVALLSSCGGQALGEPAASPLRELTLSRDAAGDPFPLGDLSPGTYGLYARANDDACGLVAAGCDEVEVTAGGSGELVVTLRSVSGSLCPSGIACQAGRCAGVTDGGPVVLPDAGPMPDAGPRPDGGGSCDEGAGCELGGLSGTCHGGACCVGCWDGASCVDGLSTTACGAGGGACATCDDGISCTDDLCASGACVAVPDDTNTCATGTCHGGACCEGCWDGTSCQIGDTAAACGGGGGLCQVCACPTASCDAGVCESPLPTVVGAGNYFTCAVVEGSLLCWGENERGQLGQGTLGPGTDSLSPVRVGTNSDWLAVAAALHHACGIRSPDALYCWGGNPDGGLGIGDTIDRPLPVSVSGSWSEIFARDERTCGRQTDGSVWCWGENNEGEIGVGDLVDRLVPTLLPVPSGATSWLDLGMGYEHICGVDDAHRLWCWGDNSEGQLGVGDSGAGTERLSPTQVGLDSDWAEVAAGEYHSCALKMSGSLWCWGANWDAQMGLGTDDGFAHTAPERVGARSDWSRLFVGEDHSCALTTGGERYCWGEDGSGQQGRGDAPWAVLSPTRAGMETDWDEISLGDDHSCGIRAGGVYCWGRNSAPSPSIGGQLGLGDTAVRTVPNQVCLSIP